MLSTVNGMRIIEAPNLPEFEPKISLNSKVTLTPEFRLSFNTWLEKRFGVERYVLIKENQLFTHPSTAKKLMELN